MDEIEARGTVLGNTYVAAEENESTDEDTAAVLAELGDPNLYDEETGAEYDYAEDHDEGA